jgi:hypothetical protein
VGAPQSTFAINLADFETPPVFFVQNVRRSGEADNPDNAYDANNQWSVGSEPTCSTKNVTVTSTTGTVGTISGSGPWTAKITGMTNTTHLTVGATFTATAGATGTVGTGGTYSVVSIDSATSITFRATGGTTPRNGSISNIRWNFSLKYPYVIPNAATDSGEAANFTAVTGSSYKGYPSEFAYTGSAYYGSSCAAGDLYVQGSYTGMLTLASEDNIYVTRNLLTSEQVSGTSTGEPLSTSTSTMGLVSENFVFLYRPLSASNTWADDWSSNNASNLKVNAGILAVNQCWAVQRDFTSGSSGYIYVWGSIAQKYRCPVGQAIQGISGGYSKQYRYDTRFANQTPPYMIDLSQEPWLRNHIGETNTVFQAVGTTKTYTVLSATDLESPAATQPVSRVKVLGGPATVPGTSGSGTGVTVTTTGSGLIVVGYDVSKGGYTETRHLAIWAQ